MSGMFWEEVIVLIVVVVSVPALVYALQKLTGRRFNHKLVILLLYVVIFSIYLEINERRIKHQPGEDVIELSFSNFKSPLEFFDAGGRFEVMFIERKLNKAAQSAGAQFEQPGQRGLKKIIDEPKRRW